MEALNESGTFILLIQSLINMLGMKAMDHSHNGEAQDNSGMEKKDTTNNKHDDVRIPLEHESAAMLGGTAALWLLSIIACHNDDSKVAIKEEGAVELLTEKLADMASNMPQVMCNVLFSSLP